MRFLSVCSGIEAASVAWGLLGWKAVAFAEIEPFPSAVLAHHYPDVPNLGDMAKIARRILAGEVEAPDLLCGGTPCQAFSVAGLRASLGDARGGLTLKFVELADAIDFVRARSGRPPSIVFWENVPGVLNTKDNAFGCFLGALVGESQALEPSGGKWTDAGCVYGPTRAVAWRVLDAQYFGLAQRRRRVFVVASARRGFDPAEVLFERDGVRRDSAPSRGEGKDIAGRAPFGPALQCGCGHLFAEALGQFGCPNCEGDEGPAVSVLAGVPVFGHGNQGESLFQNGTLTATGGRLDFDSESFVAHTLRGEGFDASEDGTGRSTPLVPVTAATLDARTKGGGFPGTDGACGGHVIPVATVAGTLQANGKAAGSATQQDAEAGLLVPVPHVETMPTLRAGSPNGGAGHGARSGDTKDEYIVPVHCREVAQTITSNYGKQVDNSDTALGPNVVAFDTTQITSATNRSNPQPGDPCHPLAAGAHPPAIAFDCKASGMAGFGAGEIASTMRAMGHAGSHSNGGGQLAVAVAYDTYNQVETGDVAQTLCSRGDSPGGNAHLVPATISAMQVRRLTPVECERLQGFPDGYTDIPWRKKPAGECPDGPRYKALGNSWAVPVVRWIGRRIDAVQARLEAA